MNEPLSFRGRPILIETTRTEGRTRGVGGRWENMTLQVSSLYGGMFALPIELSPDVPGIELLDSAAAEAMLAIEGSLPLRQTFDGRFATDRLDARNRSDRGRPTRELQLRVSLVRVPNADERRASSAVWLEGVVAEPRQVSRHPDLPAIQLAGTILKVAFARPLDFPGVAATIDEIVAVNVAIPSSHRSNVCGVGVEHINGRSIELPVVIEPQQARHPRRCGCEQIGDPRAMIDRQLAVLCRKDLFTAGSAAICAGIGTSAIGESTAARIKHLLCHHERVLRVQGYRR